jgi:UDP-N-acetylglucosamine 2-epimerase (non-hydrolysing)
MGTAFKITHVVGARPNFMKVQPVLAAIERRCQYRQMLVHTGQHFDDNMSKVFFSDLGLREPDVNLGIHSGSHAQQTGVMMIRLEELLSVQQPDLVLVYGDVNSTLAAALVCAKLQIPLGHVEAGLRSHDRSMPEEVNRVVTDRLAGLLFTPSEDADGNLLHEGTEPEKIHFVGNVMIDTLIRLLPKARRPALENLRKPYVLVTLHRPANVDNQARLGSLLTALTTIAERAMVVFPVHPRTRKQLESFPDALSHPAMLVTEPLGYLEFAGLQKEAALVVTDSGGIQEETTYLGIPCLTVRENTERPVTCEVGTNTLVGHDAVRLVAEAEQILGGRVRKGRIPSRWDGKASERVADAIDAWFAGRPAAR